MQLTQKQKQIVDGVKAGGRTGISRSDVRLHKQYMTLADKGALKIDEKGQYHTFFVLP